MDAKDFHLAEEIRYIQRRATEHDGRFVTVGPLALFSTETGDAWLLDPKDHLAVRLARDGDPEDLYLEEPTSALPSAGKETTGFKAAPSSTLTEPQAASQQFLAILPAASRNGVDREISNMFGSLLSKTGRTCSASC